MANQRFTYAKRGRIGDLDQDFETLAYWQSRSPEERLNAVWDLTVAAYAMIRCGCCQAPTSKIC